MSLVTDRPPLKHNAEQARKVYDVLDAMMAPLVLTEGERLRLRGVLREFFYEEVSVASIEACCEALS